MADGINGSAEWNYGTSRSQETDATGLSTQSNGSAYFQRYNLSLSDQLYPQVSLRAGGLFDKTINVSESPAGQSRTSDADLLPTASLVFFNPFVSGGVGWSRREERTDSGSASPQTNFQDNKNAFLMFRPEGLPTVNLQFTRSNRYDKERETQNDTTDAFSLASAYAPVKNLSLLYSASLTKDNNKLNESDSTLETQSGRASYGDRFFNNRVSLTADYSRSRSSSETTSGHGALKLPLFPFAGLSLISTFNAAPPPTVITAQPLSPTQALIDGNLTASTGINIGQAASKLGDTRFREVAVDFVNATTVNTLDVFVVLNLATQDLPAEVADTFTWYIYTSPDNQNWTLVTPAGLQAVFDPFSNRFEISFPDVTTRYIMAAVQPLSVAVIPPPGVDVSNIFITELQAFSTRSSTLAGGKSSQGNELYDLNVRTTVLNNPMLIYNMYYNHAKSDPGAVVNYTLGNSLSLSQQLSRVLTGTARVAREDTGGSAPGTGGLAYLYSAALMANPIPTVSNSLVMSGSRAETGGATNNNNSLFLANSARLYQGIDVSLSGGESRSSSSAGTEAESTTINAGAGIVPHRNLSINLNYGRTGSSSSQNGAERPPSRFQNAGASAAFKPVETVYLFFAINGSSGTNAQRQTARNYSASWAPLSSGALQFSLSYTENVQSGAEESFERAKSAGVTWRVGPRMFLSAGYTTIKSVTASLISESTSFNADLTMNF